MSIIALIPARAGSQRIPGKNIKPLNGVPLIAYTIAAAKQSGIFTRIIVSTDSADIMQIATDYGAQTSSRHARHATAESPDVEWISDLIKERRVVQEDAFAILRPTSPFRTAATIQRAWTEFQASGCDSLRAIQPATEHPGKQWYYSGGHILPVLTSGQGVPWHSRPTQTLPSAYIQNASLEMAKCSLVRDRLYPSISGERIYGFLNPAPDGFDLNSMEQWDFAERMIAEGRWTLPPL